MRKVIAFGLLVLILVLSLNSCASILNNKQTLITTASGSNREVTILENGSVIYQGLLPTRISVNGSKTYTVQYKDDGGNLRTFQLQSSMSGWFIADLLLIGGWIIDIITGDVMVYDASTILPINLSRSQQGIITDYIPPELKQHVRIIGNIYTGNILENSL